MQETQTADANIYQQPEHLDYPKLTMFQMVEQMAREFADEPA